jgi:hypothetical protein
LRAINDPVCGGRLLTIHCCAAALYSDKAHHHWNDAGTSGIDRLRQRIFRALNSYQRRLYQLEVSSRYNLVWNGLESNPGVACGSAPTSALQPGKIGL